MSTTLDELLQSLESDASGVEKQASDSTTNPNTLPGEQNEMSKEAAYEYGRALARELVKRANQITENDRAIQDVQASQVLPVPEGTVNDVLRGIMARDQERGREDMDPDLEALLGQIAMGNADGHLSDEIRMALMGGANPEQRGTGKLIATESAADEVEKAAAVSALVAAGLPFEDASELVKAAAEEEEERKRRIGTAEKYLRAAGRLMLEGTAGGLAGLPLLPVSPVAAGAVSSAGQLAGMIHGAAKSLENTKRKNDLYDKQHPGSEGEKAAAVSALVAAGLPFEDASELVKAASMKDSLKDKLRSAKEGLGRVAKSKKGKIGAGVVGAGALAGLAAHMYAQGKTDREDESEGEKAAAVSALVAAGLPFEDASELVKAAGVKDKLRSAYEDLIRAAKSKGGKIGAGVAALGALGAGGYALKRHLDEDEEAEKAAAVDALVNAGLPFEDAAALVKAAAYELDKEASNDDLIAEILANLQG
jgi:Holliday junction resolvasome RuvABC DNA-binding subunit